MASAERGEWFEKQTLGSLPGGITTDGFGMSAMFCTAAMPFSFTVR